MEQRHAVAAIATAQAPGAIGVIRISGAGAQEIADRVFRPVTEGKTLAQLQGYRALFGHIVSRETQETLDEAVALNFRAPHSFTGEDVVEFSCHGGLYLLRRVLEEVLRAGAKPAGPGEFTRRAFLNGKMSLPEAEAVMQLISAQGEQAARAALAEHGGALQKRLANSRALLLRDAAHLAAWADYPEEEIPEVTTEELSAHFAEAEAELTRLLAQFEAGRALREGVDTVIAGRPNVGKSTLMNLLSGCERSIVTQYAGTTRDVVEETVLLGGIALRLADTAGLRETQDPAEQIGVARARERLRSAQLVLAVFDVSQPLEEEDLALIAAAQGTPRVAVVNKSDLGPAADLAPVQEGFPQVAVISAKTGDGFAELERAVADALQVSGMDPAAGMLFTERQRDAARCARDALREAMAALSAGMTFDAVTVSLESAISALLSLTGERAERAVVDEVFSHFCVGK